MFPTCSEVLEVIRGLGYLQVSPAGQAALASSVSTDLDDAEEMAEDLDGDLDRDFDEASTEEILA